MKRFLMFAMFAAIMMATSAQAAKGQTYFAGNFAFGIATDLEDDVGDELSFDPGFGFIGAVGYDMGEIRVEGEIGFRIFDFDEATIGGFTFPVDGDITALTFMINGYYDMEMPNSPLTPYVGFGLGFLDFELDATGGGSISETEFAYQVMLGLGYEISPNTVLTGGYRFFWVHE